MYITHFIHSFINGHLGYVHLAGVVNNAAMHTGVQTAVQVPGFKSFENIHTNGITS